jgi:hypothetical protein
MITPFESLTTDSPPQPPARPQRTLRARSRRLAHSGDGHCDALTSAIREVARNAIDPFGDSIAASA